MKVVKATAKIPTIKARDVAQGRVYTWGTGAHFYMSTSLGSVCLSDGQHLNVSSPVHAGHFEQQVRVVDCELHVQE